MQNTTIVSMLYLKTHLFFLILCNRDDEDLDEPGSLGLGTYVKNAWRCRKENLSTIIQSQGGL